MNIICSPTSNIVKRRVVRTTYPYKRNLSGDGLFSGQVLIETVPKEARIELYHTATKEFVKSVMSDVSGIFLIEGLKLDETYDLIAIDPDGIWEKKVSSNRIPYSLHDLEFGLGSGATGHLTIDHPQKRYWRIYITATASGSQIGLRQLEMSSDSEEPSLCVGGIPFASSVYDSSGNHSASNAFDGIKTGELPCWAPLPGVPNWLAYDFITTQNINIVKVTARTTYAGTQSPSAFIVQSSYDNVVWTDEWAVTGQTGWTANQTRAFSRPGTIHYIEPRIFDGPNMNNTLATDPVSLWRVLITENNGGGFHIITELEFLQAGVNKCTGGLAAASSELSGWPASYAFDGQKTTAGQAWASTDGTVPAWIGYAFASPVDIDEIRITARANDGGSLDRTPKSFTVQKSTDGSTWNNVWSVSGQTGWSFSEERSFPRT